MKMLTVLMLAVAAAVAVPVQDACPTTTVTTTLGPIEGVCTDKARLYLGVPFAAPPTGNNRWRPPQPGTPWTEARPTKAFSLPCAQPPTAEAPVSSEDCLYLNVFAPLDTSKKNLPVLLWLHGGAFLVGSSNLPQFDAENIIGAGNDVVVVTINYRLGAYGYLGSEVLRSRDPVHGSTGNYGLQDQAFAMEWVQSNVANFGGDPTRVLLYGQSAGGASTAAHLFMQNTPGASQFSAAALNSGSVAFWTAVSMATAEEEYANLLDRTNCTAYGLPCLLAYPAEYLSILQVPTEFASIADIVVWSPVVDGVVLPEDPVVLAKQGNFNAKVPVIVGATTREASSLLGNLVSPDLTLLEYAGALLLSFGNDFSLTANILLRYWPSGSSTPYDKFLDVVGDFTFVCPARFTADTATAAGMDVWLYSFDHHPSNISLINDHCTGACHSADLQFLFRVGDVLAQDELPLADSMIKFYNNHAAYGNPNAKKWLFPDWPKYNSLTKPNLKFDLTNSVEFSIKLLLCNFWDSVDINLGTVLRTMGQLDQGVPRVSKADLDRLMTMVQDLQNAEVATQ